MFGKAKEALREKKDIIRKQHRAEIFIKGNTPTMTQSECRETMETAGDCQALLNHLENETKKCEYMKKGWEFIEANLLDELVNKREYYIMLRMLKKPELKVLEFTVFADTYEQALSEAVKSLEEGKEAAK